MALARFKIACDEYKIGYDLQNNNSRENLLILHGWGASRQLMEKAFWNEFTNYNKLFIDLPGFGKSNLVKAMNSYEYSKLIDFFLAHIGFKPKLIIAHSFGGKIAANLGLLDKNIALIFLSNAGIIWPKSIKTKAKIAIYKRLKWLKIKKLQNAFLAKDAKDCPLLVQECFKLVVDENYEDLFSKLENQTLLCWGKDDLATPLKSGEKMSMLIKHNKFCTFEGDHFFFLKEASQIANKAKEYFRI